MNILYFFSNKIYVKEDKNLIRNSYLFLFWNYHFEFKMFDRGYFHYDNIDIIGIAANDD